ncbi:hypothetical protein [Terracidiphilus sp.]|jgi:hypothetical protein|uniref:hypothetical protein n=1 Tax=Terracidiphilus sp. TaxID=1964191 RepID=UPI003C1FB4DE
MTTLPEMRDLTQRLLSYEACAGNTSEPVETTTHRVYQKLRLSLSELAGSAGFHALASRALSLARSEVPSLSAVQVGSDGNLEGISAIEPSIKAEQDRVHEGGVILISRLLGLLFIFLGEALTLSLLREAWPGAVLDDRNSENGRKS